MIFDMANILFFRGRIGLILCFSLLVSPLSGCERQDNPSGGSTLQPTHAALSTAANEISTEQDPLLSMDLSTAKCGSKDRKCVDLAARRAFCSCFPG